METEIKIITLGASQVGKTSIINRIVSKKFNPDQITTLVDHESFYIMRDYKKKNIKMRLNFIDTAGQERFISTLPKQYIRNSQLVLLVFSKLEDLEELKNRWYKFYQDNADADNSKFIVVGNKSDTFGDQKDKIKNEGTKFAEEIDAFFITCSAKSEDNIDNLENHIITEAKRIIDEGKINKNQLSKINNDELKEKQNNNKKAGCC